MPNAARAHQLRLAVEAADGCEESMAELYRENRTKTLKFIILRVRDLPNAEDLNSETWLRIAKNIRAYDPQRPFVGWAISIAKNVVTDDWRRAQRHSRLAALLPELLRPRDSPDCADLIVARDGDLVVARAVRALPAKQRDLIYYRYYAELTYVEIADVTGLATSTIKSRLHEAMRALRVSVPPEARAVTLDSRSGEREVERHVRIPEPARLGGAHGV